MHVASSQVTNFEWGVFIAMKRSTSSGRLCTSFLLKNQTHVYIYSRISIIWTPVCHVNVKGVQINEFVRISELSDKIYYLAS